MTFDADAVVAALEGVDGLKRSPNGYLLTWDNVLQLLHDVYPRKLRSREIAELLDAMPADASMLLTVMNKAGVVGCVKGSVPKTKQICNVYFHRA